MSEIKVGDVVRLKSGGPEMTIDAIKVSEASQANDAFGCVWFDIDNERGGWRHCFAFFSRYALEHARTTLTIGPPVVTERTVGQDIIDAIQRRERRGGGQ